MERYPKAFPKNYDPIIPPRVGILADLTRRLPNADPDPLRRPLANHTTRDGYLLALAHHCSDRTRPSRGRAGPDAQGARGEAPETAQDRAEKPGSEGRAQGGARTQIARSRRVQGGAGNARHPSGVALGAQAAAGAGSRRTRVIPSSSGRFHPPTTAGPGDGIPVGRHPDNRGAAQTPERNTVRDRRAQETAADLAARRKVGLNFKP